MTSGEDAGAQCPDGGTVLNVGLDTNGNGQLDADEILQRNVFCNAPPPAVVVRLQAEPAGAHCAQGGTAVLSGPDTNGNGVLDDAEVTHTDYVCGQALLTRFATEPAGAHCLAGGVVFFIGRDRDGDGQLADTEVEQTEYECSDVLSRDITIASDDDVAALANIREIDGLVKINGASLGEVVLPALTHLDQSLLIEHAATLQRVSLPKLRAIGGALSIDEDPALTVVDAPVLTSLGSDLDVSNNPALSDLSKLHVQAVGGSVSITNNAALSALAIVGEVARSVTVSNNPALLTLSVLPSTPAVQVSVINNGTQTLSIAGPTLGGVIVRDNTALTSLSLSSPRIEFLTVTGNPALTSMTLDPGASIGDAAVIAPQLTSLFMDRAHVGALELSAPVTFMGSNIVIDVDLSLEGTGFTHLVPGQPFLSVGGALHLRSNPALIDAWFQPPGGGLVVNDNAALTAMLIGNLDFSRPSPDTIYGSVHVSGNPRLRSTQFLSGIRNVTGDLALIGNASLSNASTADLVRVDGAMSVIGNPQLAAVELPALATVKFGIEISDNQALHHVAVAAHAQADMDITHNPALPACELVALFATLGGIHTQSGNDDAATCP